MSVAARRTSKATSATVPWPPLPVQRFTVEQYHRMIQTGVLTENNRVELLDGWIVPKMTHNPPHDVAVDLVQNKIAAVLPPMWRVRVQSAITTRESEPEPDVAVVRSPARRYARSHPRPKDIALLVEVADATLLEDRKDKGPLYARAGIPVYWIVNLIEAKVEVYSQPQGGKRPAYRHCRDYGKKESVPLIIAGRRLRVLPVRSLLP